VECTYLLLNIKIFSSSPQVKSLTTQNTTLTEIIVLPYELELSFLQTFCRNCKQWTTDQGQLNWPTVYPIAGTVWTTMASPTVYPEAAVQLGIQLLSNWLASNWHRVNRPWARSIQSIPNLRISLRSIVILSSLLRVGLPSGIFPSCFHTKTMYTFFSLHACYVSCLFHPPWLHHSKLYLAIRNTYIDVSAKSSSTAGTWKEDIVEDKRTAYF
jgi:hypothetical protein